MPHASCTQKLATSYFSYQFSRIYMTYKIEINAVLNVGVRQTVCHYGNWWYVDCTRFEPLGSVNPQFSYDTRSAKQPVYCKDIYCVWIKSFSLHKPISIILSIGICVNFSWISSRYLLRCRYFKFNRVRLAPVSVQNTPAR